MKSESTSLQKRPRPRRPARAGRITVTIEVNPTMAAILAAFASLLGYLFTRL